MQLNASVTEFENLVNGTDTILEKINISKNIDFFEKINIL